MPSARLYIAIGGNSLIKSKWLQKVEDQRRAVDQTVCGLVDLVEKGHQLVISHGNGPQVGFIMRRSEVARRAVGLHLVPLANCVADTQGAIGYQIQQSMNNEMAARGLTGLCVTLVTQVLVEKEDPAFENPSKPVGEFYDENQAAAIRREYPHWVLVGDAGRGYRRVVPSPRPRSVVETAAIQKMLDSGYHVVAAGGGGIPVLRGRDGLEGVAAVIDKDLTAALLARQLGIARLIISTSVSHVARDFGTPHEKPLSRLTADQAQTLLAQGHFPPGSMGPKIEAALTFLKNGGSEVIITTPELISQAVFDAKGTHIVPDE